MKVSLRLITKLNDCGDGGFTVTAYQTEDELIAGYSGEMTDKRRRDIITEDDPYKNGYIGKTVIDADVDFDGNVRLLSPFSVHFGQ